MREWSEWTCYARKMLKRKRKYGNNTWLYAVSGPDYPKSIDEVGDIGLRYHNTTIITWLKNGDIKVTMGGWDTVSTRARLNEYGIGVWRLNGYAYLWWMGEHYFWRDGMRLLPNGRVLLGEREFAHPVIPQTEARRQRRTVAQDRRRLYGIQRLNRFRSFCTDEIEWRYYPDNGHWVHQCGENEKDHYAALGRKTKRCRACKVELPKQLQTLDKLQRVYGR